MVLSVLYIHAFSCLFYLDLLMEANKCPSMNVTNRNYVQFRHQKNAKPGWNNDDIAVRSKSDGIKQNVNVIRPWR